MYLIRNRRKKIKQKGGLMMPYMYIKTIKKMMGKGIKKKRYKRKKQKGRFLLQMDKILR